MSDLKSGNQLVQKLIGAKVIRIDQPEDGARVIIHFSTGAILDSSCWRVAGFKKHAVSWLDHNAQYGLPQKINAIKELSDCILEAVVKTASVDAIEKDFIIQFTNNRILRSFTVTGNEDWEFGADGEPGILSNYI